MLRRDFVQQLPVVTTGLAVGAASLALTGCAGTAYVVPRVSPGGLVIPASAVDEAGGVFVQTPTMERPVWVGRDDSGQIVALLASCSHQGCQPDPVGDRFVCPCHGSEFSRSGAVLQGPAERPLTRYEVSERAGELIVALPGTGAA